MNVRKKAKLFSRKTDYNAQEHNTNDSKHKILYLLECLITMKFYKSRI